jgi:hypothetical protein
MENNYNPLQENGYEIFANKGLAKKVDNNLTYQTPKNESDDYTLYDENDYNISSSDYTLPENRSSKIKINPILSFSDFMTKNKTPNLKLN